MLYPRKLPVSKRLSRNAEEFDTVELNASFYRWPRDAAFTGWRERLPEGFTMAVKAHRGLTHFLRLKSPEPRIERFERCWSALGDRADASSNVKRPRGVLAAGAVWGWLRACDTWHGEGKRLDVYSNNDLGGHAVRNATRLRELVSPPG